MGNDSNLKFITDKIRLIGTAIMYSLSDESIKLPNNIVHAVRVDEDGSLWFKCGRPAAMYKDYLDSLPVRLHFYRKDKFFQVEVSGSAKIINYDYSENKDCCNQMLIRMEMKNITYTEVGEKQKGPHRGFLNNADKFINYLFRHRRHPRQHSFT